MKQGVEGPYPNLMALVYWERRDGEKYGIIHRYSETRTVTACGQYPWYDQERVLDGELDGLTRNDGSPLLKCKICFKGRDEIQSVR